MTPDDFGPFCAMWSAAWETCGKSCTPGMLNVAFAALEHFDLPAVEAALSAHIRNPDTGQYPPKPADVVRALQGSTADRALLAWSAVERATRSVGSYDSVDFGDQLTHQAIEDMGGWVRLCATPVDEIQFRANEFVKRYRTYTQHPPQDPPRHVPGLLEADAGKHGRLPPRPRTIAYRPAAALAAPAGLLEARTR